MNREPFSSSITTRSYNPGDEAQIVDFLNLCYGEWGDLKKWRALYANYPNFAEEDVFIMQNDGEIVGHRGLHFRDLELKQGHRVSTVALGDTAIHPNWREHGLYSSLHQTTLQAAKLRGASLALTWNLKGSTTYNHNKRTGFAEINYVSAYIKILNPSKVLRAGVSDYLHKNQRMSNTIRKLQTDLCFSIGEAEFSVRELLGESDQQIKADKRIVRFILDESSLSLVTKFRTSSGLERAVSLASLLLRQKIKVKFSSLGAFLEVARKGVAIIGSL